MMCALAKSVEEKNKNELAIKQIIGDGYAKLSDTTDKLQSEYYAAKLKLDECKSKYVDVIERNIGFYACAESALSRLESQLHYLESGKVADDTTSVEMVGPESDSGAGMQPSGSTKSSVVSPVLTPDALIQCVRERFARLHLTL